MQTMKKVVQAGLSANAGIDYSGINVGMSVARMRSDGKINQHFTKELEGNTKVICHQYGGLPISKKFDENDWKTKLNEQSNQWVVIDRGDSQQRDHVGVWGLIPDDVFDVQGQRLHQMLYGFFGPYVYRERIYKLIGVGQDPKKISYALHAIADATKERWGDRIKDGWIQLLEDDQNVANFLLKPGQYLTNPNLPTGDLDKIKQALEDLLGYVGGKTFAKKEQIYILKENILKRTNER